MQVDFKNVRLNLSSPSTVQYYFADHLGSSRILTNSAGAVCYDADFFPFGGEQNVYLNTCPQNYKFTGKERDSETGLDYFGARYYGPNLGRWMSPDPYGGSMDYEYPQSLNRYTYVVNNPLGLTDPDGRDCAYINDTGDDLENVDTTSGPEECTNSGGYWVSGPVNQVQVNDDGSYSFGYSGYDQNGNLVAGTYATYLPPGLTPQQLMRADSGPLEGEDILIGYAGGRVLGEVFGALAGKFASWLGRAAGKAAGEAGAGVEQIVAKAGSSVGNQSIKASSRAAAEEAAEKWVGAGARPIFREGEQVGFESADGTKVARWTSAGKPDPYINLANNTTGGNLHVHF